jgi:hypothetical protein
LEDLSIEQRIILVWILKKWDEMAWISLICLRVGEVAGHCEHDKEALGSIKCGEFLE